MSPTDVPILNEAGAEWLEVAQKALGQAEKSLVGSEGLPLRVVLTTVRQARKQLQQVILAQGPEC